MLKGLELFSLVSLSYLAQINKLYINYCKVEKCNVQLKCIQISQSIPIHDAVFLLRDLYGK